METLREKYLKCNKEGKGAILDEYCRNTGMDRIYVSRRFKYKAGLKDARLPRKPRKETYDGFVKAALVVMWKVFDYPCGARLASILKTETEHMRRLQEVVCSDEVAQKLQVMVASTIDEKLKHEKEVERMKQKYSSGRTPLLCSKVPVKTSADLDRSKPGVEQIDFVEHCGVSARGEYVNSLSIVDIYSGWWEGDGVMGKGQERSLGQVSSTTMSMRTHSQRVSSFLAPVRTRKMTTALWSRRTPRTCDKSLGIYAMTLERSVRLSLISIATSSGSTRISFNQL
jgi:hypothetical protein